MGWLSKIFKGSNHHVSEGRYDDKIWNGSSSSSTCKGSSHHLPEGRYNDNDERVWNGPSTSQDDLADFEKEAIDRAIALSLSEEDRRTQENTDNRSHLEDDEMLAKALQESLNVESPSSENGHNYHPNANGNFYHPMPYFIYTGFRTCAGCNMDIGHGRFLSCMGAVWHPECFCCHACGRQISDHEFSMSENHPYHKSCYKELYHPKCDVCRQFIPTNMAGLIEYRAHPFWQQKYCPAHELDRTPRCCSCERMEPRDAQYITLDDGRKLCLECLDSAIMDTNECQPLLRTILGFYKALNMKVEQEIPLLLVESQALNEAREGEKHGHHHLPETRGLCLSEEQTVSTILRRPRIGAGKQLFDMVTEPYRLTRRCEVTAILILYGLPRLLTGAILAHEMMHAWLRLQGYRTISQEVEEGICQVMGYMWLQSEIKSQASGSSSSSKPATSQFEGKLGEFFKHQIESDVSPAYGDGFRAAHQAVLKYGLRATLEHIRSTGGFPC